MESNFDVNKLQGYISLYRSIKNSPLWFKNERRSATKFEAFIDLLLSANHSPKNAGMGLNKIIVDAGEVLTSEVKLSEDWKWSRSRVRRFLECLENDHKCVTAKKTTKYTVISIVNYSTYQDKKTDNDTSRRTSSGHQTDTNNNDNNFNKKNINRLSIDNFFYFENRDKANIDSPLYKILNENNLLKYLAKILKKETVDRDQVQAAFKVFVSKILRDPASYPRLKDIIIHFAHWINADKSYWSDPETIAISKTDLIAKPIIERSNQAPNRPIRSMILINKDIKLNLSKKLRSLLDCPYDNTVGYHKAPFPSNEVRDEIAEMIVCKCLDGVCKGEAESHLNNFRVTIQKKEYVSLESAINSMIRTIYSQSRNRKQDY